MGSLFVHLINIFGASFQGRRANNEDDLSWEYEGEGGPFFLAVADGMGGVAGGEFASRMTILQCRSVYEDIIEQGLDSNSLREGMVRIFMEADERVKRGKLEHPAVKQMGTTLTCVLGVGDKYVIGNLGDSRAYILKKKTAHQITSDHSLGGSMLTRCVNGIGDKPDIFPRNNGTYRFKMGDILLLCSDGLVAGRFGSRPGEILATYQNDNEIRIGIMRLIALAHASGSRDNITVLAAEYGNRVDRSGSWNSPLVKMLTFLIVVTLTVLLAVHFRWTNDPFTLLCGLFEDDTQQTVVEEGDGLDSIPFMIRNEHPDEVELHRTEQDTPVNSTPSAFPSDRSHTIRLYGNRTSNVPLTDSDVLSWIVSPSCQETGIDSIRICFHHIGDPRIRYHHRIADPTDSFVQLNRLDENAPIWEWQGVRWCVEVFLEGEEKPITSEESEIRLRKRFLTDSDGIR